MKYFSKVTIVSLMVLFPLFGQARTDGGLFCLPKSRAQIDYEMQLCEKAAVDFFYQHESHVISMDRVVSIPSFENKYHDYSRFDKYCGVYDTAIVARIHCYGEDDGRPLPPEGRKIDADKHYYCSVVNGRPVVLSGHRFCDWDNDLGADPGN